MFFKISFFIVFIILAVVSGLVVKDIYAQKNINVKASDFYSLQGKAEKIIFKQKSANSGSEHWAEIYLQGRPNVKWFYSSDAPGYIQLVSALRKCQKTEIVFKTADLLKNKEAEIWNANVCGENVVSLNNVLEYKSDQLKNIHFMIKITLVIFFLFLLFSFLYFVFRKF